MLIESGSRHAGRSRIVTLLAWSGILGGASTLLVGALSLPAQLNPRGMLLPLAGAAALANGIGLRGRREWARRGMVVVIAYSIAAGLYGAFAPAPRVPNLPPGEPGRRAQDQVDAAWREIRTTRLVSAVVWGGINGLLIALLLSARVRAEFDPDA